MCTLCSSAKGNVCGILPAYMFVFFLNEKHALSQFGTPANVIRHYYFNTSEL